MRTRSGKLHEFIMTSSFFKKHRFQNVFRSNENAEPTFSNSSVLNNDYEKLFLCVGSEDSKRCPFQISPAYAV